MLNRKNNPKHKYKTGFTIIELLIAIFVLVVGILTAYAVAQYPLYQASNSISRLTAAYLAQEGIEIVRNIRDKKWLEEEEEWENFFSQPDCSNYKCGVDYESNRVEEEKGEEFLKIKDGFFNYSKGEKTKFKRRINIEYDEDEYDEDKSIWKVKVRVTWSQRGKEHSFEVQENLYNWGGVLIPPPSEE